MTIPESQLEVWSHQGAVTTSKNTYASVRNALTATNAPYADRGFEVFLQGSYGNDTNIRADSDVDVVIMVTSVFRGRVTNLPEAQIRAYHDAYLNATYEIAEFREGVVAQLRRAYGDQNVQLGNKCVKLSTSPGRLGVDVVACEQYRDYKWFRSVHDEGYDEGILLATSMGQSVVNYPKLHATNCTAKHQNTGMVFKRVVRMFKNMRTRLIEDGVLTGDTAPSYFIEGMLHNVPDARFGTSLGRTFCDCVTWLGEVDISGFLCVNQKEMLFGEASVQWSQDRCTRFLDAIAELWNGW